MRIALGYWQIIAINEAATAHFPLKIKLSQADYGGAVSGAEVDWTGRCVVTTWHEAATVDGCSYKVY